MPFGLRNAQASIYFSGGMNMVLRECTGLAWAYTLIVLLCVFQELRRTHRSLKSGSWCSKVGRPGSKTYQV